MAVLVVIEPRGARAEVRVGDAGRLCHVLELTAAEILKEPVALESGHVQVLAAVVVVIGRGDPHAVQLDVETAAGRDVGELAGAGVPVQRAQRFSSGARCPVAAVHEEHVQPAVAVHVQERRARSHRLGEPLSPHLAAVVRELDAGGGGDVGELDAAGLRDQRRGRQCEHRYDREGFGAGVVLIREPGSIIDFDCRGSYADYALGPSFGSSGIRTDRWPQPWPR